MNKKRFLQELERQLKHLPQEDKLDALEYYTEYLEEMNLEDDADVVAILGTPKEVARDIIGNCTERHLEKHKERAGVKSSATLLWMIILGICASPIAIPMLVISLFVMVILIVSGIVLVGALLFAGVAVVLAGLVAFIVAFVAIGFFNKLQCIGFGLICISVGVLFIFGIVKLSQLCVRMIAGLMCRR